MPNSIEWNIKPEDVLCTVGVVCGAIIVVSASWVTDIEIAAKLIQGGFGTGGIFVTLWVVSKIVRAMSE